MNERHDSALQYSIEFEYSLWLVRKNRNMINYKQLHYFWRVAKEGGITRASERLHLTPQTLSGQITLLEDNLGVKLFRR
jgi:hypothetical protein